jgi:hypothetical protein
MYFCRRVLRCGGPASTQNGKSPVLSLTQWVLPLPCIGQSWDSQSLHDWLKHETRGSIGISLQFGGGMKLNFARTLPVMHMLQLLYLICVQNI